jgi:hypothetical protein
VVARKGGEVGGVRGAEKFLRDLKGGQRLNTIHSRSGTISISTPLLQVALKYDYELTITFTPMSISKLDEINF